MGVVAATGDINSLLSVPVLLVYLAAILWTVGYDTIYAVQDRTDDVRLGVRSTAVLFGQHTRSITFGIYLSSGVLILLAAILQQMTFFSCGLIIAAYMWISYRLWVLNLGDVVACREFFIANQWVGSTIFLAFMF